MAGLTADLAFKHMGEVEQAGQEEDHRQQQSQEGITCLFHERYSLPPLSARFLKKMQGNDQ